MSTSPSPTDGLPRPSHVNKHKSHPMNTRSDKTPSPTMVNADGSWPTPAEASQVKTIKHNKYAHGNSPVRTPTKSSSMLSPEKKTPHQSRTTQEPKSAVSEERHRRKSVLAESRFEEAKKFMDLINNSTPSISSLDKEEFLEETCTPKGVLLRIFAERIADRMGLELKTETKTFANPVAMQNAIFFMEVCSQLGVSVDILLNTTDVLHRRLTPIVNTVLGIKEIYEVSKSKENNSDTEVKVEVEGTMNPMLLDQEEAEPPALIPITPKAVRPSQSVSAVKVTQERVSETGKDEGITETRESLQEMQAKALARKEEFAEQARIYEEKRLNMEKQYSEQKEKLNLCALGARQRLGQLKSDAFKSGIAADLSSCAQDVGLMMKQLARGLQSYSKVACDTEESLRKETLERKRLFNKIQEMNGNIRVFVRVRPSKSHDDSLKRAATITKEGDLMLNLEAGMTEEQKATAKATGRTTPPKTAEFDHVFGEKSTQEEVFVKVSPVVTSVLDGWHASIIAYGQTGSGKTYTMEGVPGKEGVNVRALNELFKIKEEKEASGIETVEVSLVMVEIYNENVRDLLNTSDSNCEIRQRPAIEGGGVYLPNATVVKVDSIADVDEAMARGKANRSTGSTKANQHSSRSHSVLMIDVKVKNVATKLVSTGRLSLVDLAGSERIAKTGATGSTLKEAQAINKSLSALGNVISSLKAKQQNEKAGGHVPYRDSKLTFLLQDSLGADNKTLVVVQVSPDVEDIQETNCSVTFGARARNVELASAVSSKIPKGAVSKQAQVEALKANKEKASLESKLSQVESKLKAAEKALVEEKAVASSAMAKIKAYQHDIDQLNETSKKAKSQVEKSSKKTEYELKGVLEKLEKMEKEKIEFEEYKKKSESKMKKMEEDLAAMKLKKSKASAVPIKQALEGKIDVIPEEAQIESKPMSFAQAAASPPKPPASPHMKENEENVSVSSPIVSKSKKGSKKVSFLSPRSPLAASAVNNVAGNTLRDGKIRTTPHKEMPSLQDATAVIMRSTMAKSVPASSNTFLGSSGTSASRISVAESKKALSKGAQRVSMSGGGGSRRSSVSSANRWH